MNSLKTVSYKRKTNETDIEITIEYFSTGDFKGSSGVGFFDHMLTALAKHSQININLQCNGDLNIDDHHTIEDIGICLGQVLNKAIENKTGINRFGYYYVPMDEALSRAVIDISGRPFTNFQCDFKNSKIGDFTTELTEEFFRAVSNNVPLTLHIENLYGKNDHHKCESMFKAFAKALNMALDKHSNNHHQHHHIPSTKGVL